MSIKHTFLGSIEAVVAIFSLGHHDFFWISKSFSSKDTCNYPHYITFFSILGCVKHTLTLSLSHTLPQPSDTYHRVLHSVNQLNDICSTTKVLQNLNLSFYLLFLHWLKYTRVIRSKTPFESNKTLK